MSIYTPSSAQYKNKSARKRGTSTMPRFGRHAGAASVVGLAKPERPNDVNPVPIFHHLAGARTAPGKRPGDSTWVQMFNRLTGVKTETRAFQRTHV